MWSCYWLIDWFGFNSFDHLKSQTTQNKYAKTSKFLGTIITKGHRHPTDCSRLFQTNDAPNNHHHHHCHTHDDIIVIWCWWWCWQGVCDHIDIQWSVPLHAHHRNRLSQRPPHRNNWHCRFSNIGTQYDREWSGEEYHYHHIFITSFILYNNPDAFGTITTDGLVSWRWWSSR